VATLAIITWWGHRRAAASRALAEAIGGAAGAEPPQSPDPASLGEIVERYRGTGAASIADALLGQSAAARGDLAEARRRWAAFLEAAPESMLALAVRRNLFALDRAEGRGEQAASEIRALLEAGDSPLPADVLLYELGRSLEAAGAAAEAAEAYRRLAEEHPGSIYALEARRAPAGPAGTPRP
ncbi:MAG: tetratricopeptide repeat protein, partial [Thermoanaerobaculia bacterium]